jgi:peptidoglycan hydrolase-like protein with peptidoglycan-binding domain
MKLTDNPKAFLSAIQKAGWAGSTSYVTKVYALIAKYGLTRYDLAITTTLTMGAAGAKVTALQNLLRKAGVSVQLTGSYDAQTVAAVQAYQTTAKLPTTGTADPLTLTRLAPDVLAGAKGTQVKALQALVKNLNYPLNTSSTYGGATLASVKKLQKKHGLKGTGGVSTLTWGILFG